MSNPEVVVIGGGAAGMAAAIAVAEQGHSVRLVEQGAATGGAIHRQPVHGEARESGGQWTTLAARASALGVPIQTSSVFLGVEGDGAILLDNRSTGRVEVLQARALILATGAVEIVHPRAGWHFPGVSTVGGLQVMMKETGRAPQGRVLLAGSGPLLTVAAAQMCRAGNPPVAIIEAGNPFARGLTGLGLLARPGILAEAALSLLVLFRHRVPWLRGQTLEAVVRDGSHLAASIRSHDGRESRLLVDRIGLHDGIRPNDFGLPSENVRADAGLIVVRAGDCREALGSSVAGTDGARAAQVVLAALGSRDTAQADADREIEKGRSLQRMLARLFTPVDAASPLSRVTDETILCRCEGQTVGDLRRLYDRADAMSGREIKLVGRFGMGSCQGRFCAANTAALMAQMRPDKPPVTTQDITGHRWPIRPVEIGAITRASADIRQD